MCVGGAPGIHVACISRKPARISEDGPDATAPPQGNPQTLDQRERRGQDIRRQSTTKAFWPIFHQKQSTETITNLEKHAEKLYTQCIIAECIPYATRSVPKVNTAPRVKPETTLSRAQPQHV